MTESYMERLSRIEAKTDHMTETLKRLSLKLEEMITQAHQARVDLEMTRNMLRTVEQQTLRAPLQCAGITSYHRGESEERS